MPRVAQLEVFNFTIKNQSNDTIDVYVDGDIVDANTQAMMQAFWGDETSTSYKSFRNQIDKASPKTVNVWVNSPGGHVGDAMAIHDYLNELETKGVTVNRKGRGIIASSGTYILMGNNSEMSENSFMMIHNVSLFAYGDINQVENMARAGRKFNDKITEFYSNQTGKPKETISGWMNKETWMTADEAKERGFVKNVTSNATFENSIKPEKWLYNDTAILNKYNSFINTNNNHTMDLAKIQAAITKGFQDVLARLHIENKGKEFDDATVEFAVAITNSLKDEVPTEDSIKTIVSNAVTEMLKTIGTNESFKGAITDATKGFVTSDSIKDILTKDVLTAELLNFKKTLTTEIANQLGGGTTGEDTKDKDKDKTKDAARPRTFANMRTNKYRGVDVDVWMPQEN